MSLEELAEHRGPVTARFVGPVAYALVEELGSAVEPFAAHDIEIGEVLPGVAYCLLQPLALGLCGAARESVELRRAKINRQIKG